jgi:hypothetical protein
MPPLTNDELGALKKIVSDQLEDLRRTRNAIEADGKMTGPLYVAICRECDRLNGLDSKLNEAMEG